MKTSKVFLQLAAVAALFAALCDTQGAVIQKTESFDSEASARANNWRSMGSKSYGHSFGWSATSEAGGTAVGEVNGFQSGANSVDNLWYGDYFGPNNLLYYTNELHLAGWIRLLEPIYNHNSFGPGWWYWDGTSSIENRRGGIRWEHAEGNGGDGVGGQQRMFLRFPSGWPSMTVVTNYPPMVSPQWDGDLANVRMVSDTNLWFDLHFYPPGSTVEGNYYQHGYVHYRIWGRHFNQDANYMNYQEYYELGLSLNGSPENVEPVNAFWVSASALKLDGGYSGERRQENIRWALDDWTYTAVTGDDTAHAIVLIDAFAKPEIGDWEAHLNEGFNGRVGQANRTLTVVIPPQYNAGSDYTLTVTSANPSINQPQGAVAGAKTVTFAAGGDTTANVPVEFLTVGTNYFTITSTNGASFAAGSNAVLVTSQPATPAPAATAMTTQTFDTSSSSSSAGWLELGSRSNGQDFGFSDSANANGVAGEAGGTTYSETLRASYADVDAGTPLTFNEYISASGRFASTGWDPVDFPFDAESGSPARITLGHANSSLVGQNSRNGVLGIHVQFMNGLEFNPYVIADGGLSDTGPHSRSTNNAVQLPPVYTTWSYNYNPDGGAWGNGRLSITWSNDNSGWTRTKFADVRYSRRIATATLDSFGMTTRRIAGEDAWSTNFIDNVTYTVPAAPSVEISRIELLPGNQVKLTFDSSGTNHRVDQRLDIAAGSWSPVTGVTFGGSPGAYTATFAQPADARQFYRLVILP